MNKEEHTAKINRKCSMVGIEGRPNCNLIYMCCQFSGVERLATDQEVEGSNPSQHAIKKKKFDF